MHRREFMECAALLVSGVGLGQSVFALSDEQMTYLATAPDYTNQKVDFFSAPQRQIVAAMAEVVIPRTETPGAIDAGVPKFIELMVADWFNEHERQIFMEGLADMESRVPKEHGKSFEKLSAAQQLAVMESMEAAAADSSWYRQGNTRRAFVSDAPFICQIKELTAWGFFTSEAGATQVLRTNMMPMRFDGNIPLSPDDSTWAPFRF